MHLLDEVFAERYHEHDTQNTAQQRREEYLIEVDVEIEDIERRQCEDSTRDDDARAGADALDDDVLAEHVLLAAHGAQTHGDDRNGDRGFEYLSHFQAEECCGGREEHSHEDADTYRVGRGLGRRLLGAHQRFIRLAGFQLAVGIVRKRSPDVWIFHVSV